VTVAVRISAHASARGANSGGVSSTASEIDRRLAQGQLDSEYTRIAELSADRDNPPSEEIVGLANYYLYCLFLRAFRLGSWTPPHITLSDNGEIVFEWWHREKKITFYFGDDAAEYIKVWGTNIDTEMDSGVLSDDWTLTSVWLWLHS
jgi:hypothetical protein